MKLNMNGSQDPNYRYTIQGFDVTVAGKGNGIYTIINNIDAISRGVNHPPEVIGKYIANITGSNYNMEQHILTGAHLSKELNSIILEYIKYIVLCPKCNIPETIPIMEGTKKNAEIKLSCSACKNISALKINNSKIEKAVDIIIKYLKAGKEWVTNKGMMVKQETMSECVQIENTEDTPFDDI